MPANHVRDAAHRRAVDAVASAIVTLLKALSPQERESVLRQAAAKTRAVPVPRAGNALSLVVQAIPRDREWTVAEIKASVGDGVTPKEVYNAIGYLTRKGHIRRVGPRRYEQAARTGSASSAPTDPPPSSAEPPEPVPGA